MEEESETTVVRKTRAKNLFSTLGEIPSENPEKNYIKALDKTLKLFVYYIRKDLREEKDHVIAITGYPGVGKSQTAAVIGALIDRSYKLSQNICFIPTSSEIQKKYMGLPMYSILHIDEASRGLHKQKWYDSVQQKLNLLYDVEREGHYLCTLLLMPRFQNFTENFRNFRIKYWINMVDRGIGICYKRDEDKDCKDPWHIDENYRKKSKMKLFKNIHERNVPDVVRAEMRTPNYLFYFRIPEVPKDIWEEYKNLKKASRERFREEDEKEVETPAEKRMREKREFLVQMKHLKEKSYSDVEIAATMNLSLDRVKKYLKEVEVLNVQERLAKGGKIGINVERNPTLRSKRIDIPEEFDKL